MADSGQDSPRTDPDNNRRLIDLSLEFSEALDLRINPTLSLEPGAFTLTIPPIEVVLSNQPGFHTTLQQIILTTPPPSHGLAPAPPSTLTPRTPHEPDTTPIIGTRARPSISHPRTTAPSPSPSFTTITITRSHTLAPARPTRTRYVHHGPQIGSIVSESDVPEPWRKTFDTDALRRQYVSLGLVCGVFGAGVLAVLAVGWWTCWWNGGCFWSRRSER